MIKNGLHRVKPLLLTGLVLGVLLLFAACGKKDDAAKKDGKAPVTEEPVNVIGTPDEEEEYEDPEQDIYVYPDGDWGEGFNYGSVRGRWKLILYGPFEDAFFEAAPQAVKLRNIVQATGVEEPQVKYTLMMRFIDPTHMEGRLTVDSYDVIQTILDMFATEDGICRLYGALYGYSKNEVTYYLTQAGMSPEKLAAAVRERVGDSIYDRSNYMCKTELKSTYTFSGNTIVFGDYDMCLEFDEAKKTLTVHVGNPQDEEFGRFDGGEMSMQ